MVYKIIRKLNKENKKEVMTQFELLSNAEIEKNNLYKLNFEQQSKLLLKAIDKAISIICLEQYNHLEKAGKLAEQFADELNLSSKEKKTLVLMTRYHDIGKININKDILNKPGKLNDQEWEIIRKHPNYSYEILQEIPNMKEVALGVRSHHERFDGTGYPEKLVGEEIPLLSRVLSIIDTYEVLTGGRVYREAISQHDALLEIKRCANTQFDPVLVEKFEQFIIKTSQPEESLQKAM